MIYLLKFKITFVNYFTLPYYDTYEISMINISPKMEVETVVPIGDEDQRMTSRRRQTPRQKINEVLHYQNICLKKKDYSSCGNKRVQVQIKVLIVGFGQLLEYQALFVAEFRNC